MPDKCIAEQTRAGRIITLASGMMILLFPLASIFQGIDFTDMGFSVFNYWYFFNPQVNTASSAVFLTDLTGALWMRLFPSLGAFSVKLLFLLTAWAASAAVYFSLRRLLRPAVLLPALAVAVLVITPEMQWHNYNSTTALVFCLAGAAILRSLANPGGLLPAFAASFIMTLGVFFRIPNLAGFALLLLPLLAARRKKVPLKNLLLGNLAGLLGGLLLVVGIIIASGKRDTFAGGILSLLSGSDGGTAHGPLYLLWVQVRDFFKSLAVLPLAAFSFLLAWLLHNRSRRGEGWLPLTASLAFILLFALPSALFEGKTGIRIIDFPTFIAGIIIPLVLLHVWKNRKDWDIWLPCLAVLAVMLLVPLGSNRGFKNAIYGMWLVIPVAAQLIKEGRLPAIPLLPAAWRVPFLKMLLVLPALLSVYHAATYIYRDAGTRPRMTAALDHPRLQGIHTTPERAAVINGLMARLGQYSLPGKRILAYECIPMVHYLTETIPLLGNCWPLLLSPEKITRELAAITRSGRHPVLVVRARYQARIDSWPVIGPVGLRYHRNKDRESRAVFNRYLADNGYRTTWSNGFFEILERNPGNSSTQ